MVIRLSNATRVNMQESNQKGQGGWKEFRPSKTLWFWSSVGVFLATVIVGFNWGGWVTGGTAGAMAEDARAEGRANLVAEVCVQRFSESPGFSSRLNELKEATRWDREQMIEEGDWTTLPGIEESIDDAAELCAEQLAAMDVPADGAAAQATSDETEPSS